MAYVIAEAGCNWVGDYSLAERMIEAASLAGANCVKFQVFNPDLLVGANDDTVEFCRRCRLGPQGIKRLRGCCEENNVRFLASAFDIPSVRLLAKLGETGLKIPSGQIHNKSYLKEVGTLFKDHSQIYMSTGMATHWEIWNANYTLSQCRTTDCAGLPPLKHTLMHCTTAYPVPLKYACMRMMEGKEGFSDHTMTNTCAIMAVALGAKAIEHHFYLDEVDCPDMPASFCIAKLKSYIQYIRDAEIARGAGELKFIQPCEEINLKRRDENR